MSLAEPLGRRLDIPVVVADYARFDPKEVNSLLTNLIIGPGHLVSATKKFARFNNWHSIAFLLDEFQKARAIEHELRKSPLDNTTVAFLQRDNVQAVLSNIRRNAADVVAYCCDPYVLLEVIQVAEATRTPLNWLLLDEAVSRQPRLLNEFPRGLLGIKQVPLKSNKQTLKVTLLLLNEVAKVVPKPMNLGNVSCWRGGSRKRLDYSEMLKREIIQQLNSNLNGRLTFDGGGARPLQPVFEILNLVAKDSNRAKRDSPKAHSEPRTYFTDEVTAFSDSVLEEKTGLKSSIIGVGDESEVKMKSAEQSDEADISDLHNHARTTQDSLEPISFALASRHQRYAESKSETQSFTPVTVAPFQPGNADDEKRIDRASLSEFELNEIPALTRPLVFHPIIFLPDDPNRLNRGRSGIDWRHLGNSSSLSGKGIDGGQTGGQGVPNLSDKLYTFEEEGPSYEIDMEASGDRRMSYHFLRANRSKLDVELRQYWNYVGNITDKVNLDVVVWPDGTMTGPTRPKRFFRVVVTLLPPFVIEDIPIRSKKCLVGVRCNRAVRGEPVNHLSNVELSNSTVIRCCYGLSIDLMMRLAEELDLELQISLLPDDRNSKWDSVVAEIQRGSAHLSFAPLSVSSARSKAIDFSVPYFYSGLSFLASIKNDDISLLAFLKPFSADLWIGIIVSLNLTAVVVAFYEWLSPFGLNPWGRQRTKNFSLASALWVMWGLLFSHLVQFKAPKSWPNKFLINVWGGFSVIFLASYTANIAALFAGIFAHGPVTNFHDDNLLKQRIGTTNSSGAEDYAFKANRKLWEHMQKFTIGCFEEGVERLRNGTLDMIVGDSPILDYLKATDVGCTLQTVGEIVNGDTFAIGMTKGLNIKTSIDSALIRYSTAGYLDDLRAKWYSSLPCFHLPADTYKPQALGVSSVVGVFILLGFGILAGFVILILEHLVYRHALPRLRISPKTAVWRSPNVMFFSQKLYRFINCVELLPPHHAAMELVQSIRQGHITSLFQKSVKRKENEQKRRRRSKAQFFEMIQEIKRFQQEERRITAEERATSELSLAATVPVQQLSDISHSSAIKTLSRNNSMVRGFQEETIWPEEIQFPRAILKEADAHLFIDNANSFSPVENSTRSNSSLIDAGVPQGERSSSLLAARDNRESSSDDSEAETLFSYSLVDEATLKRLTKEDLYLLWQAAESELKSQVEKLRLQKLSLQNELKIIKGGGNAE